MKSVIIASPAELPEAARWFISHMDGRKVFAFQGTMGAGKTTLISHICRRLGVADTVSSPTFAIVNEYRTQADKPVYHFDFYRIASLAEAMDTGCLDLLDSGSLCLIEWPDIIAPALPQDTATVRINVLPGGAREITIDRANYTVPLSED